MLQHGIGVVVGGFVALLMLMLTINGQPWNNFVMPLVIGGLASFFWPIVIGFWLARRIRHRRDNEIQAEVQRQLDQQGR
jgi:hypothetical protein